MQQDWTLQGKDSRRQAQVRSSPVLEYHFEWFEVRLDHRVLQQRLAVGQSMARW